MSKDVFEALLFLILSSAICGFAILVGLALSGCTIAKKDDGTLGIQVGISEETHQQVQETLDTATDTASGLSSVFPILTPIATALGVGCLTWRRMKKIVVKKQKPLEMLIGVLEKLKETDQETWNRVKKQIKEEHPNLEIKSTIEETLAELKRQGKLVKQNV